MQMYEEKKQPSNTKMKAYELLKSGQSCKEMAGRLGVQKATAAVYTIDAQAAGTPLDHERMANVQVITISSNTDSNLRRLRDELHSYNFSYNQIHLVIACQTHAFSSFTQWFCIKEKLWQETCVQFSPGGSNDIVLQQASYWWHAS